MRAWSVWTVSICLCSAVMLGVVPEASACLDYDLTGDLGDTVTVNDAVFIAGALPGHCTGPKDVFVGIHDWCNDGDTREQGYNTSIRPLRYEEVDEYTHDLQLGEVPIVTYEGATYYEFLLDINERGSWADGFLSLDRLKIYITEDPLYLLPDGKLPWAGEFPLVDARYSLDSGENSEILLNFHLVGPDNTEADMTALVPTGLFAGDSNDDYVTLYSKFGSKGWADCKNWGATDCYEKWMVRDCDTPPPPPIPEPLTAILCVTAVAGLGRYLKNRTRAAA